MSSINLLRRQTNRLRPGIKLQFDYWLLLAIVGLLVIGLLMVYSTTFDYGFLLKDDNTYYIRRQMIAAALGIVVSMVLLAFDYQLLRKLSIPLMLGTLGMLIVLLFLGEVFLGAARGFYEGSYQPSEIAKLATVLYIAHWLSTKGERIKQLTYGLLPFSLITGIVCALIVRQPDISTAVLIALISFAVFFIAGADWRQFAIAGLIGGLAFTLLIYTLPHARGRVDAYTAALQNPREAHWQVQQSLVALGSGNWFGVGLGRSTQKFGPLPFAHTDGVFAVVGEELGLVGALTIIGLFALLIWRGFHVARNARDSFGGLLAAGITCWIGFQALINLAVITAVVPFTGMPLPFLSYGGTSLTMTLVGMGILLNISRDAAMAGQTLRPQPERPQPTITPNKQRRRSAPPPLTPELPPALAASSATIEPTMLLAEAPRETITVRRRNRRGYLPRIGYRR